MINDNHFGTQSRRPQPIEAAGARLLYLPPYSPDFNPIENAFAKLKALLRKAAERTVEASGAPSPTHFAASRPRNAQTIRRRRIRCRLIGFRARPCE